MVYKFLNLVVYWWVYHLPIWSPKISVFGRGNPLVACWCGLLWVKCFYYGLEGKGSKTHSKSSCFDFVLALPKNDWASDSFWKFPDSGGMFIYFRSSSSLLMFDRKIMKAQTETCFWDLFFKNKLKVLFNFQTKFS